LCVENPSIVICFNVIYIFWEVYFPKNKF
jgi:hypothetical protein